MAARMCSSSNCPVDIATQKPDLHERLEVQVGANRLARFLGASVELMQVRTRACGHTSLSDFGPDDLSR
ncbi:MAG: glutamate synthase-related protein [Candidatus Puniceispirillaceae bacterium]